MDYSWTIHGLLKDYSWTNKGLLIDYGGTIVKDF